MPATMSIIGLSEANPNLFNKLNEEIGYICGPEAAQIIVTGLCAQAADLEVLYPDPFIFQKILDAYVLQRYSIWENLYYSTQFDYNPIWNYDRTDEETINRTGNRKGTVKDTSKGHGNTVTDDRHTNTDTSSQSAGRYGYNNSQSSSPETTATGATLGSSINDMTSTSDRAISDDTSDNEVRTLHSYGNIGVVDTAKLIQNFRDIQFDFCQFVIDDLIGAFCLLVY